MLWRPWRLGAGVMFGLAVGSKWSALVPLAAFGILVVLWDSGARRAIGVRMAFWRAAVADGIPAFGYLVVVAFVVYVLTWSGWLVHHEVYEANLSDNNYGPYWGDYTKQQADGFLEHLVQGLRSLYHYHRDVWAFHSAGLLDATHVYASKPSGWLLLNRPVGVAADLGIKPGERGCTAPSDSTCLRQILLLGTPALWWSGVLAHVYAAYAWIARRDWRYGIVVVGLCLDVAAVLPLRRPADLLLLRRHDPALHRARADDGDRPAHRAGVRERATAAVGHRGRGVTGHAGRRELRVVLADLHPRADHHPRVAAADLVPPLDLRPVRASVSEARRAGTCAAVRSSVGVRRGVGVDDVAGAARRAAPRG